MYEFAVQNIKSKHLINFIIHFIKKQLVCYTRIVPHGQTSLCNRNI